MLHVADRGPADLHDRHVLVVEDDALVGSGLVAYIQELGATVDWTTNVEESADFIEHSTPIDAAVVDLDLDGEMSTRIVDMLVARGTYTILCTGYDEDSIEERLRELPRTEKPFTRGKVRQLLLHPRQRGTV